jgi:hypothetical protein
MGTNAGKLRRKGSPGFLRVPGMGLPPGRSAAGDRIGGRKFNPAPPRPESGAHSSELRWRFGLLLICDSTEELQSLRAALAFCEAEITSASSLKDVIRVCANGRFDLIIVNLGPELLPDLLRLLRIECGHGETPILVESGRVGNDRALAGVLPRFQAMPCTRLELLRLICSHSTPDVIRPERNEALL